MLSSNIPWFIYGTAWKGQQTGPLTQLALEQGFRAIDTANQRRHYDEASVGRGIAAAIQKGVVAREHLFIQSKFTFRSGQDQPLPYDANAPIATQVQQSFASSLEHLGVEELDSYILHGPSTRTGLSKADWEAWRVMEDIYDSGRTRWLGVSNVTLEQLELLHAQSRIKPTFVQNRCYASTRWDGKVREFCRQQGIYYQAFSLLTANRQVLKDAYLTTLARVYGCGVAPLVFRFALDIGVIPLTGTSSDLHMRQDLAVRAFWLGAEEIARIEQIAG